MLILLSPAKRLNAPTTETTAPSTTPLFLERAQSLVSICKKYSTEDLRNLMSISDKIANEVSEMFGSFQTPPIKKTARQAILSFAGDAYLGLDAPSLSADDLAWSQEHLVILSGLYGFLRPFDLMQPYRLEMATKLKTEKGENLYRYWGNDISDALNKRQDALIVNLASNEYFKATKNLSAPVVAPKFLEEKAGKSKVISFYAKRARGAMARWILQNRVTDLATLRTYEEGGYRYLTDQSDNQTLVFSRPQPTPA